MDRVRGIGRRSETELSRKLKGRIRAHGPLTFKEFMAAALYDEEIGFYTKGPTIGSSLGTFNTNAMYRAFAFAIAEMIRQIKKNMGLPLRIVELGGGTGNLGSAIQSFFDYPLHYIVVEPSEGLRKQQRFQGLQSVPDLTELNDAPSLIFGNEVLDALPFHRVMGGNDGHLMELYVGLDPKDELIEEWGNPSTPRLEERLASEGIVLGRGQLGEICLAVDELVSHAARKISSGYLIFIDYGDEAGSLYHYAKRNGTLRTYYNQQETYDVFDDIGEQDITADVDFTAVKSAGLAAGLCYAGTLPQGTWLKNIGINTYMDVAGDCKEAQKEIHNLLSPTLLGTTFDVIAFNTPQVPNPPGFD